MDVALFSAANFVKYSAQWCTGVQVYRCKQRCTCVEVYRCKQRCTCVQVYRCKQRCTGVQVYTGQFHRGHLLLQDGIYKNLLESRKSKLYLDGCCDAGCHDAGPNDASCHNSTCKDTNFNYLG